MILSFPRLLVSFSSSRLIISKSFLRPPLQILNQIVSYKKPSFRANKRSFFSISRNHLVTWKHSSKYYQRSTYQARSLNSFEMNSQTELPANEVNGVDSILSFWFGDWILSHDTKILGAESLSNQSMWFKKDEKMDAIISSKFSNLIEKAHAGELSAWEESPRGSLSLIILLDQFTRNSFRGTSKSFAYDDLALAIAKRLIDKKLDESLTDVERLFVYMPFMHSENIEDQNRGVHLFEKLSKICQPDIMKSVQGFHKFAIMHQVVVENYGRFPHRNEILGRKSTPEEVEFLSKPGSSF